MDVGDRLMNLRQDRGITAKELATRCDVSPSFISSIEHQHKNVSVDILKRICEALDISLSDFFHEKRDPIDTKIVTHLRQLNSEQKHRLYDFLCTIHPEISEDSDA